MRELGKPARVDADTKYMIASNTKAMATLMLAKLVDAKKLTWDTPATKALPSFKLGNAQTTSQVQIKHLICACTGMPRQDLEWLLEFKSMMPADAMKGLGTMQPTSNFGDLFQYSNPMAAAAGFLGGHVAYPDLELGAAYDRAMNSLVFEPLGMTATTHDFNVAQRGNFAAPHAPDIDGKPAIAVGQANLSIVPVRPAGGAWSSVNDVMKYVVMELGEGKLPNGERYISRDALLARRAPQVSVGTDTTYGMGLQVNNVYGTPVVHHGGDMIGYHSDMMWLPEHGVGAVILTNGDPGWLVRTTFRRKLLEVLFDGRAEADASMAAAAKTFFDGIAAERKLLTVPADPALAGKLASRYEHPAIGGVAVSRSGGQTVFDFGEWSSPVATRKNPDGTVSFVTTVPGFSGLEFVAGDRTHDTGDDAGARAVRCDGHGSRSHTSRVRTYDDGLGPHSHVVNLVWLHHLQVLRYSGAQARKAGGDRLARVRSCDDQHRDPLSPVRDYPQLGEHANTARPLSRRAPCRVPSQSSSRPFCRCWASSPFSPSCCGAEKICQPRIQTEQQAALSCRNRAAAMPPDCA